MKSHKASYLGETSLGKASARQESAFAVHDSFPPLLSLPSANIPDESRLTNAGISEKGHIDNHVGALGQGWRGAR